jgi:hypothetical protein
MVAACKFKHTFSLLFFFSTFMKEYTSKLEGF